MEKQVIYSKIQSSVENAKHIILVPHQHPDGDALGSSTAFAEWLTQMNKSFEIFCHTKVPNSLPYLNHLWRIRSEKEVWDSKIDLVIVFDSGDTDYAGVTTYIEQLPKKPTLINIDHHVTNLFYGDINLVDTTASSTCEIVYLLLKTTTADINENMATSLLTGIITDTDNFTNSATTTPAIGAASELVAHGAKFNTIKETVYKNIPLHAFGLWGKMFSRLNHHEHLNMIYTHITQQDLFDHRIKKEDAGGMTNFLNTLEEGLVRIIFHELETGHTKGSFRTTREDVDVSHMAKHFGGGGHKKAAGFTIEKPLPEAIEFVLKELELLFPHGVLTTENN